MIYSIFINSEKISPEKTAKKQKQERIVKDPQLRFSFFFIFLTDSPPAPPLTPLKKLKEKLSKTSRLSYKISLVGDVFRSSLFHLKLFFPPSPKNQKKKKYEKRKWKIWKKRKIWLTICTSDKELILSTYIVTPTSTGGPKNKLSYSNSSRQKTGMFVSQNSFHLHIRPPPTPPPSLAPTLHKAPGNLTSSFLIFIVGKRYM